MWPYTSIEQEIQLTKISNAGILAQAISSSVPQVSSNSSCPTTNSTSQATNATASTLPTSDCDKLGKTYVSTIGIHTEFNVYCDSDPGGAGFLGVFVYSFKDAWRLVRASTSTRPIMGPNPRMLPVMGWLRLWTSIKIRKIWEGTAF